MTADRMQQARQDIRRRRALAEAATTALYGLTRRSAPLHLHGGATADSFGVRWTCCNPADVDLTFVRGGVVIGIVTTLATGTCRHCGLPIHLGKSDLERKAYWFHDTSGQRPCADAPMASPAPCPTCSGPVRETVGMVCQTCGADSSGGGG